MKAGCFLTWWLVNRNPMKKIRCRCSAQRAPAPVAARVDPYGVGVSKEIWLGPVLGGNRARLIERCADLVSKGQARSFLYLAASHPLLEIVTEGVLDGRRNRGVWGELPVYLFRGFVQRILSTALDEETGSVLTLRTPIDREELPLKRSVVSQILKR